MRNTVRMTMLALAAAIGATYAYAQAPAPGPRAAPDPAAMAAMQAARAALNAKPDSTGDGPYPAMKEADPGLPDHVVYRPADLSKVAKGKLGIVAWGNGGCSTDGASQRFHVAQLASYGYVAIAPGNIYSGPGAATPPARTGAPPGGAPGQLRADTTAEQVKAGIDWAIAENARKGSKYYQLIDTSKVAVAGFSCGGLQAIQLASDPRVKAVIVQNSGVFPEGQQGMANLSVSKDLLAKFHTPVIYILGGPKDIAYANGMDDFKRISHVPVVVVNQDTGHGGTYDQPNGGPAGKVAAAWLEYQLRGDKTAEKMFVGEKCGVCTDPHWTIERKNFPAK